MATITNFETLGKFFVGQGDMIIFDTPTDYSTATLSSLANPKSLGDIKGDSTSWTGDDASISNIMNEQGNNVVSYVRAGTLSFEAEILSTSPEIIKKFLGGTAVTSGATFASGATWASGSTVTGFGNKLPVIEAPIAIANDTLNRTLIFPKAKIIGNFTLSDGALTAKISVIAQGIDTASLQAGMIVDGSLNYPA